MLFVTTVTFINMALKISRKNGYQYASVLNIRKDKQICKILLEMLSGLL
jgi:hypothetical protein